MWQLDSKESMDSKELWALEKKKKRIDSFELCCWRRLLSPLDSKEIQPVHPFFFFFLILLLNLKHCICFAKHQNESATGIHVLPEIISEYSLERLMLKLKLQYLAT